MPKLHQNYNTHFLLNICIKVSLFTVLTSTINNGLMKELLSTRLGRGGQ